MKRTLAVGALMATALTLLPACGANSVSSGASSARTASKDAPDDATSFGRATLESKAAAYLNTGGPDPKTMNNVVKCAPGTRLPKQKGAVVKCVMWTFTHDTDWVSIHYVDGYEGNSKVKDIWAQEEGTLHPEDLPDWAR